MRRIDRRPLTVLLITLWTLVGLATEVVAQDKIPNRPVPERTLELVCPPDRWADTVFVRPVTLPAVFDSVGMNGLTGDLEPLVPIFERLRKIRLGAFGDTVRILHVGDSHVRGHIYPQTVDSLLVKTFGAVCYEDMGVNGATCLTFTHPKRIEAITEWKPELLILSFGTNESHNRRYNANTHYHQMDELVSLLRQRLPDVPILLTTPPGSYDSFRQSRRRRTYKVNPRTATAVETILRYADDHHLPAWNLYAAVGGKERACLNWMEAGLMRPDHVHYFPEGYVLQGQLLYQAFIQAYNDYVTTH